MFLNRIVATLASLFHRRRSLAFCPVRKGSSRRYLLIVAAVILSARAVDASVLISGDVTPSDNPFTTVNEALPSAGNKIDPFATPTPAAQNQTLWEGINDPINNTNINTDVFVGRTGTGILQISQVELRDMNMVIGDSVPVSGGSNQLQYGNGTVYITGMGSLYNNDPDRVPPGLPSNFRSKRQRKDEGAGQYVDSSAATTANGIPIQVVPDGLDGYEQGFDLYVGRTGVGTLKIDAFGRAEIADAVLVGDSAGATGNLIIDGFNSTLVNGGSRDYGQTTQAEQHMTIIGRQGTGNLWITNGATMTTLVFATGGSGGSQGPVGASLGSSPYTLLTSGGSGNGMDAGGVGIATLAGNGSKWTIGGSLQVGGFDNGQQSSGGPLTTGGDLEGDDVLYPSQAGRGTLYVNDGAIVTVQNAVGAVTSGGGNQASLVLAIGRFGVVDLNGGTIQVGSALGNSGGGQNQATPDTVQVINDGIIRGSGRINTGVFRNRYLGEVRVDATQSLTIDSSSQFTVSPGTTSPEPLSNYGKIFVSGNVNAQAQLEFVRSNASLRPFLNLPLDPALTPPAFTGGQISAQYANLRFGSGLQNQSMVAFTAGTNNVFGKVVSLNLDELDPGDDGGDFGDTAQVLVSGNGTTAVFHDDLAFGEGADLNLINGGKVVVLNQHSFVMAGNLSFELSYTHPSLITVAGDVGIGPGGSNNDLSISFASDVLHSIKHGDAFQIISYTGDIGNVNTTTDPFNPIIDYAIAPQFTDIDFSPDVTTLYGLVPQVQFANQGVYVVFLDPTMVGPGAGAIAPDFNGDGVVDTADFAIWKAHVGQTGGASVLDGDADGDGDVDGADFLKWQRNVGKPMPWTGAGSGLGSGSGEFGNVPEPATLTMLACGSLALAFGRRRPKR